MEPSCHTTSGSDPRQLNLKSVDERKLGILDRRIRGVGGVESSFTPPRSVVTPVPGRPRDGSEHSGNLTEGGRDLSLMRSASVERGNSNDAMSDQGAPSNASCQTVHHANMMTDRENWGGKLCDSNATKIGTREVSAATLTATSAKSGSKKKSTPSKRPVSAIGDRRITPTNRPSGSAGAGEKKARTKFQADENAGSRTSSVEPTNVNVESGRGDGCSALKQPAADHSSRGADQTSRSESRDTLYSYFGTSTSNQTNSNPPRSQLSSPPALQSKSSSHKENLGKQRTLHMFLGISDKKGDRTHSSDDEGKKGGIKSEPSEEKSKDDAAGVSSAGKSSSDSCPKKKKSSLKISSSRSSDTGPMHSGISLQEIKRLHTEISSLQKQLDDANARNNSIRNNQTLVSANLQRQLKHQKSELEDLKKESSEKMNKAMVVMETLVKTESVQEAKELRQKLASDGARLGRLVTSRVGPDGLGGIRSRVIESWEDGHAPKMLKRRKEELKKKRDGLVSRRAELEKRTSFTAAPTPKSSNNHGENLMTMTDLDQMEAMETLRMHLDEMKKAEVDLEREERSLNIEKRAHVRALKLVSNEDSSRFRVRRKLHNQYVLMNLLGKGGFSEVWRAFDLVEMRHVAVKVHQLESSWSDAKKENYTKHVSREFEIHREVRHPRVVSLYDVFEIDTDSFATVLECCNGTDLDTVLKDKGRLPERDARAMLLQILSGMRYLSAPSADGRRQGIIHYDLKPGNILFDEQGNAKITDFGLSKIVDATEEGDSMELTSQGAGTYWYLPPECFVLDQDVRISNKVDVWSIGVIYYQMLFGRRPFGDGQSQDHILRNHIMLNATEVCFPSNPVITEEGYSFIRDCLTYDQMGRPNMSQICEHNYLKLTTL